MKKKKLFVAAALCVVFGIASPCYAEDDALFLEEYGAEEALDDAGQVASSDEMAPKVEIEEEGMTPIPGSDIRDGEYSIEVSSSSSMFKIVDCTLKVEDSKMSAVMTMSGTGYLKLFMGTGAEAVEAAEEEYIPFVENEDGQHTYEIPVEALDQSIDCAAFSKRKEKWYDRQLLFQSSSLPQDAFLNLKSTNVADLGLEDGNYQVAVTLEGGSGKTKLQSPADMEIKDGKAVVTLAFETSHFDYMLVSDEKFTTVNEDGNSVFQIPVEMMDWKMPVVIDTVALGSPVELDYTLEFDSSSVKSK